MRQLRVIICALFVRPIISRKCLLKRITNHYYFVKISMGLLKNASVQDWDDAEEARKYSMDTLPFFNIVHEHGVLQFINVYKKYMNSCCAELRWGDEVFQCVINDF